MPDLLLVDDNRTTQRVFELSLAQEGVSVHCFNSGAEVLNYLQDGNADLVFLNVSQRDGDGYELCRRVKSSPRARRTPVVLLIGAFQSFDSAKAEAAGCRAHLSKPFETSHLVALVRELLAGPEVETPELPSGTLFRIPVRDGGGEMVFDLPDRGSRPSPFALPREIVLPKPPRFEAAPAPAPAEEVAAQKRSLSDEEVQRIADRLADKLPHELSRLLPDLIRRSTSSDE